MPLLHETAYLYRSLRASAGQRLMPRASLMDNPHSIGQLALTVRAWNCLVSAGIMNRHRLCAMTDVELLALTACGPQTVADIRTALLAFDAGCAPDYRMNLSGHQRDFSEA